MNIRSGEGATIGPLYLPEIEEAAAEMQVNPAYLVEMILARVDWRATLPAIRKAREQEMREDLGPLFSASENREGT
jgi:hypothetical protein